MAVDVEHKYIYFDMFMKLSKAERLEAITMLINCLDSVGELEVFINFIDLHLSETSANVPVQIAIQEDHCDFTEDKDSFYEATEDVKIAVKEESCEFTGDVNRFCEVTEDVQVSRLSRENHSKFELTKNVDKYIAQTNITKQEKYEDDKQSSIGLNTSKLFSCEKCHKQFKYRYHLNRHRKSIHEGVRHPCDVCNKQFRRKAQIWEHKKSAHEGLRYSCEHCNYKATTKENLTRHNVKYHDAFYYECSHCNKKYTSQDLLKIHENKYHGVRPFSCEKCERCYKTKSDLSQHLVEIHNNTKQKPSSKGQYSLQDMATAIKEVLESGLSISKMSRKYNVPRKTLESYVSGKTNIEVFYKKLGRNTC